MKATAAQKIKIGMFTVIAILIFVVFVFTIGNQKNLFAQTFDIYGLFRNISGLQIGNNVRFGGINVGNITSIDIVNDTTIKVTMKLKEKVHRFLKDDATATIGSDGLMGDKLINISPGVGTDQVLAKGGQVKTVDPVDYDKIVTRITNVVANAETITSALAGISSQINAGKGSIGRLVYSDSLARGIESTVRTTHETMEAVHATVSAAHETINSAKLGVQGFDSNMTALKHNFLLKGFYKKKDKRAKREERKEERKERKEEKQEAKQGEAPSVPDANK